MYERLEMDIESIKTYGEMKYATVALGTPAFYIYKRTQKWREKISRQFLAFFCF